MSTMDEEAQKRNTDCVYFLASPLTCKKGNECEYRHSESARINPRDCWYWLTGTCLNASCPYRHPPLEGRPATPATAAPTGKLRVPCFYFAQGYCAKGDKCPFMHGMAFPPMSDTVTSQKPSKPVAVKAAESNEKQVASSKGNGSVTSKPPQEFHQQTQALTDTRSAEGQTLFSNAKVSQAAHEQALKVNDVVPSRLPEGSGSSGPARPRNSQAASAEEISRQVAIIDDRRHQAELAEDNSLQLPLESRMHEAHSGEDKFHQGQIGDDRLHPVQSGEERIQNGVESEEWWEESSPGFDVLVDDGPDQLIYAEDIEYLSHHDLAMESGRSHLRGRMMVTDDLADFEYDQSGAYDQTGYYDAPVQYELTSYDPYDQLGYDQLNSYDHISSRQAGAGFKDRQVDVTLLRERRELAIEDKYRRGGSSRDLRNHIVKRRRAERSQGAGDDHFRRRHQDALGSDFQHSRRHQDTHAKQQEVLARHRILAQPGARAHRRSHGRSESRGNKRAYRDIGSDYEGISVDKSSKRNPHNSGEYVKARSKRKERGWLAPEVVVEGSETKGHTTTNNRRQEPKKDDSTFAGPKSLAQIKAEKIKAVGEENWKQRNRAEELWNPTRLSQTNNATPQPQIPPLKSQISPGSGLSSALKTGFVTEDRKSNLGKAARHEMRKVSDFEGPKTLSAILKAKRKADSNGDFKVAEAKIDQEQWRLSLRSDVEDGEFLQDSDPLPSLGSSEQPQQVLHSYKDKKTRQNDVHIFGTRDGPQTDLVDDMEDGAEGGDHAVEDVDFDDDDDDDDDDNDDFARKLDGIFT